jgi:hypothetical protein
MQNFWKNEGFETAVEVQQPLNRYQRFVWDLIERPDSTLAAKILGIFSIAMIIM